MDSIDAMVALLDAREPWEMYRAAMGHWCIRLGSTETKNHRIASGKTIAEALTSAIASLPLPQYPRRPVVPRIPFPTRSGGTWMLEGIHYNIKTKKAAEDVREKIIARVNAEIAAWDAQTAPLVGGKTEGVDFYFG